jgi:hypothetical protein
MLTILLPTQGDEADVAAEVETVRDPALKYGLEFGVAFLHDIMRPEDRAVAERLFAAGTVQVQLLPAFSDDLGRDRFWNMLLRDALHPSVWE